MKPSSLLHFSLLRFSLFTFHSSLLTFSLSAAVVDFTPPMTGAHPAENLAMASDALEKVLKENPKAFVAVHPGGDPVADAAFANFCDRRRTFWAPDGVPARCATTDCVSTPWVPEMRCPELICQRLARIARKGDRHFSCVWIGDSITHYWEPTQAKYFPDYDILNLGIAADLTQNVLWRLKYGSELEGYSTDLFMVMIGTNNSEGKPEETAKGIKAILDLVREKHPTTPILLCAIFPRGEKATDVRRCTNDKVNEIIKGFANGKDILWLDFRKDFLTADGTLTREVMKDLLHPAPKGYEIWQRNVAPVFAKYCRKASGAKPVAGPVWPKATVTDADGVISIMPATPGPAVTRGYVLGGVCEAVQNARRAGKPYRLKPNPDCEDVNFDAWPLFQQQNLPLVPCPGSSKWCVWQTTKDLAYLRKLGTNPVETVVFGPSTMGDVATICKTAGVTLDLAKPFFRLGDWNTGLNAMLWFGQYGMLDGYAARTIVINFPRLNGSQDREQQDEARRRILKLVREKHPESDVRLVEGGTDTCIVSASLVPVACSQIRPGIEKPADFEAFWRAAVAKLDREVPVDAKLELDEERFKRSPSIKCYRVSFATANGRRVHGFLTVPTDASKGPYPLRISVPGAGLGSNAFSGGGNEISLVLNVHPYANPPDKAEMQALYDAQEKAVTEKWGVKGYFLGGIAESREAYFYYPVILGFNRALNWVIDNQPVDTARITYSGTSQGGAFGLILSGLNGRITRTVCYVPALCDHLAFRQNRRPGWPRVVKSQKDAAAQAVAEKNAPYFDAAFFASMVKNPIRVVAGLVDTTCPPDSVAAAYNLIPSKDKAVEFVPGMGHNVFGEIYRKYEPWGRE